MIQGFGEAKKSAPVVKRLVVSVEGRERVGKTTFGLSAPGPLAYFPIDPGREGVLEKAVANKKKVLLPLNAKGEIETFDYRDATDAKDYERLWMKFKEMYVKALDSKEVKSIVVDTGTEAWELVRIARFGKLTQVQPYHYGPVNAEFRDLIKHVYKTDKNLVIIHKVKNEYVNDKRTGGVERAGFSDIGYLVQSNLLLEWDKDDGFSMVIKDSRQNMEIAGMRVPGSNFVDLATLVYPETSQEDWE